ncbi:LLM class flavin-dependent oxidoreductase [Arthrobacter sp. SD76]|uniref:LLM class flavin-dependent oxidoreductase n=1 Tax=Arthrobacter sp. SD76 TaxID=3415007 RepID=UPI003C72E503
MYIGLFSNPASRGPDTDREVMEAAVNQILRADDVGFSVAYVTEHHFSGANVYSDPFMFGAWLAPQLKNSYLGIAIMSAPYHHPLRMVEYANVLDVLTKGRCIVGMATGLPDPTELGAFGIDMADRRDMVDERMRVMLKVWDRKAGDEPLDVSTNWDKGLLKGRVVPTSYRKHRPLFGRATTTDETIVECAELGLPVMFGITFGFDENSLGQLALYRDTLAKSGHSAETIEELERWIAPSKFVRVTKTQAEADEYMENVRANAPVAPPGKPGGLGGGAAPAAPAGPPGIDRLSVFENMHIAGTPDVVIERIREFEKLDIHHIRCSMMPTMGQTSDLAASKASFDLFVDEVLPHLDPQRMPDPVSVSEHWA